MSSIKCLECQGTGKTSCEVHGSHPCKKCDGKGCTDKEGSWTGILPSYPIIQPQDNPIWPKRPRPFYYSKQPTTQAKTWEEY